MPIYAICDFNLLKKHNLTLEQYIKKISTYNVVYIQYRDKENDFEIKKQNIIKLKSLTDIKIIVNDDLTLVKYGDGLHLGQDDTELLEDLFELNKQDTIEKIKILIENKILGISTHNKEEIQIANSLNINYIGLGAYRATSTKNITNILGDEISALAFLSNNDVVAIGGVKPTDKLENIKYLAIGNALLNDSND